MKTKEMEEIYHRGFKNGLGTAYSLFENLLTSISEGIEKKDECKPETKAFIKTFLNDIMLGNMSILIEECKKNSDSMLEKRISEIEEHTVN